MWLNFDNNKSLRNKKVRNCLKSFVSKSAFLKEIYWIQTPQHIGIEARGYSFSIVMILIFSFVSWTDKQHED